NGQRLRRRGRNGCGLAGFLAASENEKRQQKENARLSAHWNQEPARVQRRAGVPPAQRARQREPFRSVSVADGGRRDACPTLRFMERAGINPVCRGEFALKWCRHSDRQVNWLPSMREAIGENVRVDFVAVL